MSMIILYPGRLYVLGIPRELPERFGIELLHLRLDYVDASMWW